MLTNNTAIKIGYILANPTYWIGPTYTRGTLHRQKCFTRPLEHRNPILFSMYGGIPYTTLTFNKDCQLLQLFPLVTFHYDKPLCAAHTVLRKTWNAPLHYFPDSRRHGVTTLYIYRKREMKKIIPLLLQFSWWIWYASTYLIDTLHIM